MHLNDSQSTMPIHSLPPSKKQKLSSRLSNRSSELQTNVTTIAALESQLTAALTVSTSGNSGSGSLNPIADLYSIAANANISAEDTSKAIWALYRVWVGIIGSGRLNSSFTEADSKIVKAWLRERLNEYVELLCGLLKHEEKVIRTSSLRILFSIQKHLSTSISAGSPEFHNTHFRKIVHALVFCPPSRQGKAENVEEPENLIDIDVLELFHSTWLGVYDDIRWFFLRQVGAILQKVDLKTHPYAPTNALSILEKLASSSSFPTSPDRLSKEGKWWVEEMGRKPPKVKKTKSRSTSEGAALESDEDEDENQDENKTGEEEDDWRKFFDEQDKDKDPKNSTKNVGIKGRKHTLTLHQSLHNISSHRAVFTHAWLSLLSKLSVPGSVEGTRNLAVRALNVMHRGVLPFMTRPVLVMDWVGACVDYGGTPGLLALNALFILMKEYNLDYPSFYTRLYAFLDRDLLHLKHRARFFRLAEVFLGSSHLPLTLLASFIKRLSVLSLSAPPSAIVIVIPFVWNLMKKHPGLMGMIHREWDEKHGAFEDPYVRVHPSDPLLTDALSSSLFELHAQVSHYHAPVSSMAKVYEGVFTKEEYKMEDFLDHGYGSLFEAEANRKIKKAPALNTELELMLSNPAQTAKGKKRKIELFTSVNVQGSGTTHEAKEWGKIGDQDELEAAITGGFGGDIINELWQFEDRLNA
ncbi:ribosome biogenesis protein Noc4 [Lentinula boryana]|uniref:Ribosome biogenesis protein Noc4 n=1 Tax=Lentinula boryana TaxID=40481 RepID=A0ABQ8QN56_9AGAR|nr:ribosome biogenesis protein Noc4 [Lentinula boryana]